jgi:hypothetical protein
MVAASSQLRRRSAKEAGGLGILVERCSEIAQLAKEIDDPAADSEGSWQPDSPERALVQRSTALDANIAKISAFEKEYKTRRSAKLDMKRRSRQELDELDRPKEQRGTRPTRPTTSTNKPAPRPTPNTSQPLSAAHHRSSRVSSDSGVVAALSFEQEDNRTRRSARRVHFQQPGRKRHTLSSSGRSTVAARDDDDSSDSDDEEWERIISKSTKPTGVGKRSGEVHVPAAANLCTGLQPDSPPKAPDSPLTTRRHNGSSPAAISVTELQAALTKEKAAHAEKAAALVVAQREIDSLAKRLRAVEKQIEAT